MNINPFLPSPVRVRYPQQYVGDKMYARLLKNNLTIVDGYWYCVNDDMDACMVDGRHVEVVEINCEKVSNEITGKRGEIIEDLLADSIEQVNKGKIAIPFMRKHLWLTVCPNRSIDSKQFCRINGTEGVLMETMDRRRRLYPHLPQSYFNHEAIILIEGNPTLETFGHSLEAMASASRCYIHWVEAGKEKEFLKFAEQVGVPPGWKNGKMLA